ncbi:MAG: DUF1599 domain-containing protein [Schleiferiaceae bacterium]|nr:DUF1599 domain-containing protein [Schleiferiaceae bacterium]
MKSTEEQFDSVITGTRYLFSKKLQDYGAAWRALRLTSLTDQLYIKVQRLRSIEEKGAQKVDDPIEGEYIGVLNYSIIALIQLELGIASEPDLNSEQALLMYDNMAQQAKELMANKNHDYGEAWRGMRLSSITDMIFQKILRIKQIEDNKGKTLVSEGLSANYLDMINYAVFALIKIDEAKA